MEKLPGDYIAGFVDGEGCFVLKFHRDVRHERRGNPTYFYWGVEFAILLRWDDRDILESIKSTLDCGNISTAKRGAVRYAVENKTDLVKKIIPFFEANKLRAKKLRDFELWKEAVMIIYRTKRKTLNRIPGRRGFSKTTWKKEDLIRLLEIQQEMRQYKSKAPEWKWLQKAKALAILTP